MRIIPVFLAMKGCPRKCVYCDQNSLTGTINTDPELIKEIVFRNIRQIPVSEGFEIAFYGGTFTGLPEKERISWLQWTRELPGMRKIRISTRPDHISHEIIEFLSANHVKTIELGVQSFMNHILSASGRGYGQDTIFDACHIIQAQGLELGIQLMAGLPEESESDFFESVRMAIEQRPAMVRLYPALVLPGTELASMFAKGEYHPLRLETAVRISADAVMMFRKAGIPVIRIGVRSLKRPETVIAGPYHPQFKYMVESEIILRNIMHHISPAQANSMEIICHPSLLNYVLGFKKANMTSLGRKGFMSVNVRTDSSLSRTELFLDGGAMRLEGCDPG